MNEDFKKRRAEQYPEDTNLLWVYMEKGGFRIAQTGFYNKIHLMEVKEIQCIESALKSMLEKVQQSKFEAVAREHLK